MALTSMALVRILGDASHASTTLKQFNAEVATHKRAFEKDFGEVARIAQRSMFVVGAVVAGTAYTIHQANQTYDRFVQSNRKVEAAAKLTGVSVDFLRAAAEGVRREFELTSPQANEFVTEISKLTDKAGDISRTGDAVRAFINLGAAQGLNLEDTLTAVHQAILGIDEGTDKLFQKNPSVLYKEYADRIGTTVGKLTDQQKALALVTAAQEAYNRVGNEYSRFLQTAEGQQQRLNNELEEAQLAFAEALQPARITFLREFTEEIRELTNLVNDNQDEFAEFAENIALIIGFLVKFGGEGADWLSRDIRDANIIADRLKQVGRGAAIGFQGIWNTATGQSNAGLGREFGPVLTPEEAVAQLRAAQTAVPFGPAALPQGGAPGVSPFDLSGRHLFAPPSVPSLGRPSSTAPTGPTKEELDAHIQNLLMGMGTIDVDDPRGQRQILEDFFKSSGLVEAADAAIGRLGSELGDVQARDRRRAAAVVAGAARHTETDERRMLEHAEAVERVTDVIAFNLTDALMILATDLGRADEALGHFIQSITREFGGGLMQQGAQQLVGGIGASLAEKLGSVGGPAAMLGIGFGITAIGSLFGSSREREEEQYRAHLRALKEARQDRTSVTIMMPRGSRTPFDAEWMETISQTLEALTGAGMGRVDLRFKEA